MLLDRSLVRSGVAFLLQFATVIGQHHKTHFVCSTPVFRALSITLLYLFSFCQRFRPLHISLILSYRNLTQRFPKSLLC